MGCALAIGRKISFGLAALCLSGAAAHAADLEITIKGIQSDAGAIMIGVYANPEGFANAIENSTQAGTLNDRGRLIGVSLRAKAGEQSIILPQLPPGRYAVIAFHDENDDGRLDENGWGVPVEGYGFSNNATALLSAPSFDAAAATVGDAGAKLSISLAYPVTTTSQDVSDLQELFTGR